MIANRFLCIHAHFYQPPRENPWLEEIELQESAAPFHDWNRRISAECYRPNGTSRILDPEGWIVRLANNYSRLSFNFGPTLLSWMEEHDQAAYGAILEGDRLSLKRFGGHGAAIAQAYNHAILPLANRRDKETQIKWGLRDFESRFGRAAEAMWLPETAVDTESLEILAAHGMKYVILAPRQAQAMRTLAQRDIWHNVKGEKIDPHVPYHVTLPGGQSIAAFFYDGPMSRAVAFEGLLNNGEVFADRLMSGFTETTPTPQLVHIATDGESYGHHHKNGDMALAYALHYIKQNNMATVTNYGQFLERFPPQAEAQIFENSSWSCAHGVLRWSEDCGCNSGMSPDSWNQAWRKPLRAAFDDLRDRVTPLFENFMAHYTDDVWGMRNQYIDVILDRSPETARDFFKTWLRPGIDINAEEQNVLKAFELQRLLLLIYTSCAWFFDEVSGIETVQNLLYAARAIELVQEVLGEAVEAPFMKLLAAAPSNVLEIGNAQELYKKIVPPARVDFFKIAAHLATTALFQERVKDGRLYCFDYRWKHINRIYSGKAQLICAHVEIVSRITHVTQDIEFAIIHLGDHNLTAGSTPYSGAAHYKVMVDEFIESFGHGDLVRSVRLLDKYFDSNLYSLKDLFRDQQKDFVNIVLSQTLNDVEAQFLQIYQQQYPVMSYLSDIKVSQPPVFSQIARFVQTNRIRAEIERADINLDEIKRSIREAKNWGVELDAAAVEQHLLQALWRSFTAWRDDVRDLEALQRVHDLLRIREILPFPLRLGDIQSAFAASSELILNGPEIGRNLRQELGVKIAVQLRVRLAHEVRIASI